MKALVIIKPDGLSHMDYILKKLRKNNIKILAVKTLNVSEAQARQLYQMHEKDYFHQTLLDYMQSGTSMIIAVDADILRLKNIKKQIRNKIRNLEKIELYSVISEGNATDKKHDDNFIQEYFNTFDAMHCSDPGEGDREVALFFSNAELNFQPFSITAALPFITQKLAAKAQTETIGVNPASLSELSANFGVFSHDRVAVNTITPHAVSKQILNLSLHN